MCLFKKSARKDKKGQNIWKSGQICTKFENNLKESSLMRATNGCTKQLEYVLPNDLAKIKETQSVGKNGCREECFNKILYR